MNSLKIDFIKYYIFDYNLPYGVSTETPTHSIYIQFCKFKVQQTFADFLRLSNDACILISVGYNLSGKPVETLVGGHFPFCWNFGWQRVVRIPCRQVQNFILIFKYLYS